MSAFASPTRLRADPRRQIRSGVASFVAARQRAQAVRYLSMGLAAGGALAALAGCLAQIFGFDGGRLVAFGLALAPALGAAAFGWLRRVPDRQIALEIDHALALDERVTTALELAQRRDPSAISALGADLQQRQVADAVASLVGVRAGAVYPLRVSRRSLALVALAVLLAVGPWFAPWPAWLGSRAIGPAVAVTSLAEADRLETLAQRIETQGSPADQATRSQIAVQLRQAAAALRRSGTSSTQSTQALSRANQAISSLAPPTGENAAITLARIADALNTQQLTQGATSALDQQNVDQAAAALDKLAADSSSLSPDQRQQLAQALQAASQAAQGSDTGAAQALQNAAQAAQNGDAAGVQAAAQALQQLGAASQAQRDVAQAQSELQASSDAVSQAASGNSSAGSPDAANSASQADGPGSPPNNNGQGDSANSPPLGSGSAGTNAQASQNGPPSGQPGGGIGKGSTSHLGAAQDPLGLAQRDVVVPTDQTGDPSTLSTSNQLQSGASGSAQVDYVNVLPQYRQQALQAVDSNVVPTGLKSVVKGYFDSLAPKH
jgi:hypothetical protein